MGCIRDSIRDRGGDQGKDERTSTVGEDRKRYFHHPHVSLIAANKRGLST